MKLSKRLAGILEWIDCDVLADIGCDHGYLCGAALQEGRAKKAYACDVNEGPLAQAKTTARQEGLEDRMEIRLQNGMENLPEDVDQVVIAGMGGTLIEEILEAWQKGGKDNPDQRKRLIRLVISAHKDVPHLRRWLTGHSFHIERERILREGHFYPVMEVVYRPDEKCQSISDREAECGVSLVQDEQAHEFIDYEISKLERILEKMPEESGESLKKRLRCFQEMKSGSVSRFD